MNSIICPFCSGTKKRKYPTSDGRVVIEDCPDCTEPHGQYYPNPFQVAGVDPVSHPPHYNQGKIEVIEFIEDKALNFHRGNAVKYICRAGKKDKAKEVEDLEKAIWYLRREIECLTSHGRDKVRPNDMVMTKVGYCSIPTRRD